MWGSRLVQFIRDSNSIYEDLSAEWIGDDELIISTHEGNFEPDVGEINSTLGEIIEEASGGGGPTFFHSVDLDPPVTNVNAMHRIESDLSSYPKVEWGAGGRKLMVFVHDEDALEDSLDEEHIQNLIRQYQGELHVPYLSQDEWDGGLRQLSNLEPPPRSLAGQGASSLDTLERSTSL